MTPELYELRGELARILTAIEAAEAAGLDQSVMTEEDLLGLLDTMEWHGPKRLLPDGTLEWAPHWSWTAVYDGRRQYIAA